MTNNNNNLFSCNSFTNRSTLTSSGLLSQTGFLCPIVTMLDVTTAL